MAQGSRRGWLAGYQRTLRTAPSPRPHTGRRGGILTSSSFGMVASLHILLSTLVWLATGLEPSVAGDRLEVRGMLWPGHYLTVLQVDRPDDPLRLDAHWRSHPVVGCGGRYQPCFLMLGFDGELAVHAGRNPWDLSANRALVLAPADPEMSSVRLVFQEDGDLVLLGTPHGYGMAEQTIWSAGSRFPPTCPPEHECAYKSIMGMHDDGALAMHRGTSATMEAYMRVGRPAVTRLRNALWHNNFTKPDFDSSGGSSGSGGGRSAPLAPWEIAADDAAGGGGENVCRVPPALGLVTFPNSGTSFTLLTVSEATQRSVFTVYPRDVGCAATGAMSEDECQDVCGHNACREYGMCQLFANLRRPPPPSGKGALLKSHVHSYGDSVLCGTDHLDKFERQMAFGEHGGRLAHYAFLRLFRNPFDNVVARFHLLASRNRLMGVKYDRPGFLHKNGQFPRLDVYIMLSWHLFANIALSKAALPTSLLDYESMYTEPQAYLRAVLEMLGWTKGEVSDDAIMQALQPRIKTRDFPTYRGELLPGYLDEWYSPEVVQYMANVIHRYLDETHELTYTACVTPDVEQYVVVPPPP